MSRALSVCHGAFGRASLYELDRPYVRHVHREAHLLFFLGGAPSEVVIGSQPVLTDQVNAIAVNPWESHFFAPVSRAGAGLFLIFYFNPDWLKAVSRRAGAASRIFADPTIPLTARLRGLRDDVCQRLVEGVCNTAALECELVDLIEAVEDASPAGPAAAGGSLAANWRSVDFRLRKSFAALSPDLPVASRLEDVARSSGLSRAHFFKLFRDQLGLTPSVYVNALRIETALEQIVRRQTSITAISEGLGFSCQSAFTRFFSAHVGMSPTAYQRAVQVVA
jgi:AraC-like DNA-binding protein